MGDVRRVLRQLLVAALLAAAIVVCLRLGWWQLQRYHSPGGSLQNLGYTLQWPTFALFAIFMVWRLRKLERERRERPPAEPPPPQARAPAARPAGTHDDEPDDELAAYNRYLAQLNALSNAPSNAPPNAKEQHSGH